MTGKQSIEAFERARTWRAYIKKHDIKGCVPVIEDARETPQQERMFVLEEFLRGAFSDGLDALVMTEERLRGWGWWPFQSHKSDDLRYDRDIVSGFHYLGHHGPSERDNVRHMFLRLLLLELKDVAQDSSIPDEMLGCAVDHFLMAPTNTAVCTTCAQFALDAMSTNDARLESTYHNFHVLHERTHGWRRGDYGSIEVAVALWLITRRFHNTKAWSDEGIREFVEEHPDFLPSYLPNDKSCSTAPPIHRSTLRRMVRLGLVKRNVLEQLNA